MRLDRPEQRKVQSQAQWTVRAATMLLALVNLSACQLFESTCAEEDRTCLGGGTLRSGKVCVRDGDCAEGLKCVDNECKYDMSTKRGGNCIATAECTAGLYCSPIDLVCRPISEDAQAVGGDCATSEDCQKGLVCDADVNELLTNGPFGLLPDSCREGVERNDTPESCSLPRTCTKRGNVDRGGHCDSSHDCLAGLYCVPDIIDLRQSVCFGGEKLPVEPISLPLWGGIRCPADDDKSVAYFDVPRSSPDSDSDFYRLPFPNDIRRSDSGLDLSGHPAPPDELTPQTAARYLAESAKLDGFGTNPVVFFRFSKPLRNMDLSLDTLRIVDITPNSPEYGRKASIAWGPTKRRSNYICPNWIGIHRPVGSPLRPGTTYAAIVTKGVRTDDSGENFERSSDLESMLSDSRPSDSTLGSAWDKYAPLRAYLNGDSDIPASQLLNAAVFTTQAATDTVAQLRAAVEADGTPKLADLTVCKDGVHSPCEDDTGRGKCHKENAAFTEIHGRVLLPIFQSGTAPYETPDDGGDIVRDASGKAKVQSHARVCLALSVPKAPPPRDGYPVLIVAHPTGGSFSDQMGSTGLAPWAATLTVPSIVMSFDLPVHGDRRGSSTRPPQDLYFNLLNPKAARGNALQGAADLISVAHLMGQEISKQDSPLDSAIPFDATRVALYGHSQGATHAALMIGGEPRIRSAVLAGLAGHITSQLLNLKRPTDTASVMPFLLFDPDNKAKLVGNEASGHTAANPMLSIMQGYLDSSDPINFAYQVHLDPPETAPDGHDFFLVYGLFDSFTPEASQKAYADAAALAAVDPDLTVSLNEIPSPAKGNQMPGKVARTVGLRTYDPKDDAIDPDLPTDGHFVSTTTRRGSADVRRFLEQALAGETPQIGGD
jgi:hypothetical protein